MFGIGWGELALIFIIILVLFGPKQAQGIFKAFGKGLQEFKDAMSSVNINTNTNKQGETADFQQKKDVKPAEKNNEEPPEQQKQQETGKKQDLEKSDD